MFESQPDAKFWAGERYYRRQHIEIDDFYPLDMSGYGAGVEDLQRWTRQAGSGLPGRSPARHCNTKRQSTQRATSTSACMT
jgi:maltoporin